MVNRALRFLRRFEKDLWLLSVGWFVSALGFSVSIPFVAIYFQIEYGLSITRIGLFFGALALVRSLFQAAGGELSDRLGRKPVLIYSQYSRSAVFLFLGVSIHQHWGFWPVATALLINAVFGALFQPAANAMVSDLLPQESRLEGYAITRSAANLGWAAGPALAGFLLAKSSYATLFVLSSAITLCSGLVFRMSLTVAPALEERERFRLSDVVAVKNDPYLAIHSVLIFTLYVVVAQLIAPFSLYAVQMVGISATQLGYLYTLNGLLVVSLQIPVTRLVSKCTLTAQLAAGAFLYAAGYSMVGLLPGFEYFVASIVIVTLGEITMSPPSLALTSRLAPRGKMGRYMGVFGFFVASGWSLGPLYGGVILDHFGHNPAMAWMLISSLAILSGTGYVALGRRLPKGVDSSK